LKAGMADALRIDVGYRRGKGIQMLEVFEAIRTVLAVRRYQDKPVPEATQVM
jgi:hypothetical protein